MTTDKQENPPTGVTVLGLGQMGRALAAALLGAGHRTTVWNRTTGRAEALEATGASVAPTSTDAVLASPLILLSVGDYRQVQELLDADPEAYRGRSLVNLTTGTPEQARGMAGWAERHDVGYLDGAMMAVPQTVGTPDAFFLYSGSQSLFEAQRPVLDVLATSHYLGSDPAMAELWDLALLGTGYATLTGFLHGAALLATVGVRAAELVPLAGRWIDGMVAFLADLAGEIDHGDYQHKVSPIDMNRHAVTNLIQVSESEGVDAAVHQPLRALLERRSARGAGGESFSSLFEELRAAGAPTERLVPRAS